MKTCQNRNPLEDSELQQVSGGVGPEPTGGHVACDLRYNPNLTSCTFSQEERKAFAALGECQFCKLNPASTN